MRKPLADLTGPGPYYECDCLVDFYDLEFMAGQWLDDDCNCVEEYGSMQEPRGEPNLVAWYQFNDGSGSTATDSSGNNYHGTIEVIDVNVFWVTPGPNGAGYALEFQGGWVSVPNEIYPKLNLPNSVTVCAWINIPDQPIDDEMPIVWKGGGDAEYALDIDNDGQLRFRAGGMEAESDDKLPTDVWHHIAGVCGDGNNITLYLNGQVDTNEIKADAGGFIENQADPNYGLGIGARW
ncbi:MAG: LamG domain-containing protein, partial [Planctomycetota bacterium]